MADTTNKKGMYAVWTAVFVIMLALGAFVGGQVNDRFFETLETRDSKGKAVNILVMGIDARKTEENSRSDTMIVVSLDPATRQVVMVSIPRDTRIKNSKGQNDRINSVNWLQGPEAAAREAGKLLNIPVDYYVVTNFGGFGDIVDALGGVHIELESNMYHADPVTPELAINLKKGYQYLDGRQALAYVRYRGGPTADIGRTENQQKFVRALAREMLQTKTMLRLPQLIPELYKNVRTNIPLTDMVYLGKMAQKLDLDNIITQTLPGYFLSDSETGASYWEADKKIASTLVEDLKKGGTVKVVQDTPPSARPVKMVIRPVVGTEQTPAAAPVPDEGAQDETAVPIGDRDDDTGTGVTAGQDHGSGDSGGSDPASGSKEPPPDTADPARPVPDQGQGGQGPDQPAPKELIPGPAEEIRP